MDIDFRGKHEESDSGAVVNSTTSASERLLAEQQAETQKPVSPTTTDKALCGVALASWAWLTFDTGGLTAPVLGYVAYGCRNEVKSMLGFDSKPVEKK